MENKAIDMIMALFIRQNEYNKEKCETGEELRCKIKSILDEYKKTLQPEKPESECHHKFENKSFIEKCLICGEEFKRDYISQWYRENPPNKPDSGLAGIEKLELDLIHLGWHDVHKYKKIEKMPNGRLEEIDDLKICLLGMEEQFNKNFKKIADRINKQ